MRWAAFDTRNATQRPRSVNRPDAANLNVCSESAKQLPLAAIPLRVHEQAMQLAIAAARANPLFPFGAVIVRAADREVMATGVNNRRANPTLHGEIVAINDFVTRRGNRAWGDVIFYSAGEPCPMCMSALAWAQIGGVVYGTSIETLQKVGIDQIRLPIRAAPFYVGEILGHVLESETDTLFRSRKRVWRTAEAERNAAATASI